MSLEWRFREDVPDGDKSGDLPCMDINIQQSRGLDFEVNVYRDFTRVVRRVATAATDCAEAWPDSAFVCRCVAES